MYTQLPYYILGIVVGIVLSDGSLEITNTSINARLSFELSLRQIPYFLDVFFILSHYCQSYPTICKHVTKGVVHFSLRFRTRSLPVFTELLQLFYSS